MNEINKKEIKQRGKGLLALVLAFMMMFGSSLTVFATNSATAPGADNDLAVVASIGTSKITYVYGGVIQGGGECSHNYQWVTVTEPVMTTDGLQQKMCTYCGALEERRVITASSYFVKEVIEAINAAPDNSTLEIEFPLYQCLTDQILKVLEARETVSLRITFEDRTDPDNIVIRDVTIPAGQVSRAYNENQTNGLLYYGSVYGWN